MSKTYTIRPLVWEWCPRFAEWRAENLAKGYVVRACGDSGWVWTHPKIISYIPCDSLEEGKAKCEEHYRAFIEQALEEVQREPVAWLIEEIDGKRSWFVQSEMDMEGYLDQKHLSVTPVYKEAK